MKLTEPRRENVNYGSEAGVIGDEMRIKDKRKTLRTNAKLPQSRAGSQSQYSGGTIRIYTIFL